MSRGLKSWGPISRTDFFKMRGVTTRTRLGGKFSTCLAQASRRLTVRVRWFGIHDGF